MKPRFLLSLLFTLIATWGYSQNKAVSGKVTDKETDQPLAGVTVMVVGHNNTGAVTGADGRFSLMVPSSANRVTVSFVGYEPQTVDIVPDMDIILESSANALETIVISGYAMVKKKDLTGAVSVLRADENFAVGKVDAQQAMQGRIAGVNVTRSDGAPGGGVSVQIRGTSTLYGSTEPLYVVDGVPLSVRNVANLSSGNDVATQNSLSFLDPNDIESIEVLKDASSIALYGSRGVNGVVLITTRTGQGAGARDKVNINYNVSISDAANRLHMLSSREYAGYVNQTKINTAFINGATTFNPGSVPYNGQWNEGEQRYNDSPESLPDDDNHYWQDQIFRTAISHDLNVEFNGGAKGFEYSISGGLLDQQGVVKNSYFQRYTGKIGLTKTVRKWLQIGSVINISYTKSGMLKNATNNWNNGDEGVIRSALFFPPTYKADDPRVLNDEVNALATNPLTYTEPLNQTKGYTAYTSNFLNITFMKGLIFRTVLGYNSYFGEQNQYYGRKLWEGEPPKNGLALAGDNTWASLLWENMLMFNRDFGKHNVSATLASSWESSNSYYKNVSAQGFASDYSQGWILQDATTINYIRSDYSDSKLMSGVFRGAYNYDSKYFLTLTARVDASSKFRKGNRTGFFPSVGVGYTLTQEKFMEHALKTLNNFKVRFSYGVTGNQAIGSYGTYALMVGANYPFGGDLINGYAQDPYNVGNKDLKWESTYQADLGFDIGLFNRVNLTVDLYDRVTKDVLQPREPPASAGYSSVMENIGTITNRGFEVTLNVNIFNRPNNGFRWDAGLVFSANRNEITHLGFGSFYPKVSYGGIGNAFINAEGHPVGQLYGYVYEGIWKSREEVINSAQFQKLYSGYSVSDNNSSVEAVIKQDWMGEIRYADRNGDDSITEADQTYLGTTNPKFIYGFSSNMSYKGFDLYVQFQGVYGNKIYNQSSIRFMDIGGSRNLPVDVLRRAWSPENPDGTLPKLYEDYGRTFRMSMLYYEDGSYLKLRTVTLGYTFRNIKYIGNMRLYVSGNNLLTFTKYSGFDPEVNSFSSSPSIRGIDGGGYPQARSVIFGVNLNF